MRARIQRSRPLGAAAIFAAACGTPPEDIAPDNGGAGTDAGGAADTLVSESFEDLAGAYAAGDFLGDWRLLRAVDRAVIARASDVGIPEHRGRHVAYFSAFSDDPGFSESRFDRCVEFDPKRAMSFDYYVYADIDDDVVTDDLRVRVNPNFYASFEACQSDVNIDSTSNRLEEGATWYNEDWDVRLEGAGAQPGAWFHADRATDNAPAREPRYEPEVYPERATTVRFSIRVRDDIYVTDPTRRLYLDDIRLTQP